MNTIYWTLGDTDTISATLLDRDGAAVNLSGASVRFVSDSLSIDAAATVSEATAGVVTFAPGAGDLTAGANHSARFVVTFGDGTVQSFPNKSPYIKVIVTDPAA